MSYPIIEISFATPAFDEALRLRNDILRVPLGLEFYPEDIIKECDETHLGIYSPDFQLLGCLTLRKLNEQTLKMRQVAIAKSVQGLGLGRQLVEASEEWARVHNFSNMSLHAREVAVPFYKKLSYLIEGQQFMEVNIPHFKMIKKII